MLCCTIPTLSGCCKDSHIDDVLSGTKAVLEAVSTGTSNIPIPGIDIVIQVLIGLVNKIQETRSNSDGFRALSEKVSELVNVVERAISKVKQDIGNIPSDDHQVRTHIEGFSRDLQALKMKAEKLYSGPLCLRWFHSSRDAATLEELQEGIVACITKFQLECQVAIAISMEEVLTRLSNIEDENTLELLPHAEASYRAAVNATKSHFLPGTRVKLFQMIDKWVEQNSQELSGKPLCIVRGDAGTGKSTVAWEFARRCDVEKQYGASFFFVHGESGLDSTPLVFPTLAYQLARSQGALYPHIVKAAREHLKGGKLQLMMFQAPTLIHQPIRNISQGHPVIILVIDALDQCPKSEETLVLEMLDLLLASVHQARFPFRIFFTSCPDSFVEEALQKPQWAPLVCTVSLHEFSLESKEDIKIVVDNELNELPSGKGQTLRERHVPQRLAERAAGLFIYAEIAIDFLRDYPRFVEDGLDNLLSRGSSTFATALQPLDDLYLTILETAFPEPNDSESVTLCNTLGNLAVLRNSVSLVVLEALMGLSRNDVSKVLTPLRAVVVFNKAQPDEKVGVKHPTFSAFLLDKERCMNETYFDNATHHHSRLVVQCLGALQTLKENMIRLPDTAMPKAKIINLVERLKEHVPGHVQYACVYWAAHLGDACHMKKKTSIPRTDCYCWTIGKSLEEFIGSGTSTKLRAWVEIMTYMGRLDTVAEALRIAQEHIKDVSDYEEVKLRFAETEKLVTDHYSEIEECPYKVHQF